MRNAMVAAEKCVYVIRQGKCVAGGMVMALCGVGMWQAGVQAGGGGVGHGWKGVNWGGGHWWGMGNKCRCSGHAEPPILSHPIIIDIIL